MSGAPKRVEDSHKFPQNAGRIKCFPSSKKKKKSQIAEKRSNRMDPKATSLESSRRPATTCRDPGAAAETSWTVSPATVSGNLQCHFQLLLSAWAASVPISALAEWYFGVSCLERFRRTFLSRVLLWGTLTGIVRKAGLRTTGCHL